MKIIHGIQLLIATALVGIGLRTFENGEYPTAALAAGGLIIMGSVVVAQVRNHADRKALKN